MVQVGLTYSKEIRVSSTICLQFRYIYVHVMWIPDAKMIETPITEKEGKTSQSDKQVTYIQAFFTACTHVAHINAYCVGVTLHIP